MRKVSFFLISIVTVLLIGIPFAHAQEVTTVPDTSWGIENGCTQEVSKAPDGWHYDGTILYQGKYGIHGKRADWDVPHVLAFTHVITNRHTLFYGQLSPDLTHYAAAEGDYACRDKSNCHNTISYKIMRLHVFDTTGDNPRNHKAYEWHIEFMDPHYPANIMWINDHQLIYPLFPSAAQNAIEPKLLDINTGEQTTLALDSPLICRACSPDRSRQLKDDNGHLTMIFNDDVKHKQITLAGNSMPPYWVQAWTHDSQHFFAIHFYDPLGAYVVEYDRDGNFIGQISPLLDITPDHLIDQAHALNIGWSPNGKLLWLEVGINSGSVAKPEEPKLFLGSYFVDIAAHKAKSICWYLDNGQWSPDSQYYVGSIAQDVFVYEIATMAVYKVVDYPGSPYDFGFIMWGWRDD